VTRRRGIASLGTMMYLPTQGFDATRNQTGRAGSFPPRMDTLWRRPDFAVVSPGSRACDTIARACAIESGPTAIGSARYVNVDPPLDRLHSDPRWPLWLRRMNLPIDGDGDAVIFRSRPSDASQPDKPHRHLTELRRVG
jgi:hypothetical protein